MQQTWHLRPSAPHSVESSHKHCCQWTVRLSPGGRRRRSMLTSTGILSDKDAGRLTKPHSHQSKQAAGSHITQMTQTVSNVDPQVRQPSAGGAPPPPQHRGCGHQALGATVFRRRRRRPACPLSFDTWGCRPAFVQQKMTHSQLQLLRTCWNVPCRNTPPATYCNFLRSGSPGAAIWQPGAAACPSPQPRVCHLLRSWEAAEHRSRPSAAACQAPLPAEAVDST